MGISLDQQALKTCWIYKNWYYNPMKQAMGWLPRSGLVLLNNKSQEQT